jgi:hypothetical protein
MYLSEDALCLRLILAGLLVLALALLLLLFAAVIAPGLGSGRVMTHVS